MASPAQKRATKKWIREKTDEFKLRIPKGERELIRSHAAKLDETMNGFILRAIRETMACDEEKVENP